MNGKRREDRSQLFIKTDKHLVVLKKWYKVTIVQLRYILRFDFEI